MKIWDICYCLRLVSVIVIKSSSNESILKKNSKISFHYKVKILIFGKMLKVLDFDNALTPNHSTYNKAEGVYLYLTSKTEVLQMPSAIKVFQGDFEFVKIIEFFKNN